MKAATLEQIKTLIRTGQVFDTDAAEILRALAAQPLLSRGVTDHLTDAVSGVEDEIDAAKGEAEIDDSWMARQDRLCAAAGLVA